VLLTQVVNMAMQSYETVTRTDTKLWTVWNTC